MKLLCVCAFVCACVQSYHSTSLYQVAVNVTNSNSISVSVTDSIYILCAHFKAIKKELNLKDYVLMKKAFVALKASFLFRLCYAMKMATAQVTVRLCFVASNFK